MKKTATINAFDINNIDKERVSIYINILNGEDVLHETENGKIVLLKEKINLTSEIVKNSKFVMKLFDIDRKVDGSSVVNTSFIAPSLSIATQCFNKVIETTINITKELKIYSKKKSLDASPSYRSVINLLIHDIKFLLVNSKNLVQCHPVYLFQSLSKVYALIADVDSLNSELLCYSHDNFAIAFNRIKDLICAELAHKLNKFSHIDYYIDNNVIYTKSMSINDDSEIVIILKGEYINQVKVCAPSRINTILSMSLAGAILIENEKYKGVFNERKGYKAMLLQKSYDLECIKNEQALCLLNYKLNSEDDLAIIKV
ncbi:hypothetical protein [Piscirickettsia litoralis]|uniref:Uncharacterized protein n=1 Tax=Piscirickettsia litoralis TaxID=1891921 RepID=A0ABX2ZZ12_9GAMM|nr:hypothetical protein [Piscirickettsia litoralis]ODN41634.1 hypothetical protein BGC07_16200 [Piscirickettsia litoralis]